MNDCLRQAIIKSGSGGEYDVAVVVQEMYKNRFIFNGKTKTWFEMRNGEWCEDKTHNLLAIKLRTEVPDVIRIVCATFQARAAHPSTNSNDRERLDSVVQRISGTLYKMKKTAFLRNVMTECKMLFHSDSIIT